MEGSRSRGAVRHGEASFEGAGNKPGVNHRMGDVRTPRPVHVAWPRPSTLQEVSVGCMENRSPESLAEGGSGGPGRGASDSRRKGGA
jgi:hypothetical protein